MTGDRERLPVAISLLALLLAVATTVAGSHDSSASFVVSSTSPGNQIVTLSPQAAATYSVPVSRPAGAVELVWTASSTAALRSETRYSVHRSPSGVGTYTQLASGLTALTYTDTPGSDGSYDYKIRTDVSSFNAETTTQAGLSDRVAPGISGSATPTANANGWQRADTTVSFSCSDAGSGVASCPSPVIVSTEGAGQSVGGTATDAAGNTASTSVSVSLDKTPPVVSAPSTSSGKLGGAATVNVSWSTTETLSGIASYTLRWTSAAVTCPAANTTNYLNSIPNVTSTYLFTGSTATSYCFYLIATDNAGNVGNSANSGSPRLAQ